VVPHIEFTRQADLVLIAPASADFMTKAAIGLGNDLLSTLCLYATCPIWMAPAMNVNMWNHPAIRQNHKILRTRGVRFLGPVRGHLACGDVGEGRFVEPTEISFQVETYFKSRGSWRGKRVVVTAGPTQEDIDPVRFITNRSSGKMGYALAQAALNRGAEVTLVHGPTSLAPLTGAKTIAVRTAEEMRLEVHKAFHGADYLIMAAAVADYAVKNPAKSKMKKSKSDLSIALRKNPDILGEILNKKKDHQVVVGFAAETDKLRTHAKAKWAIKPCDLLIANRVGSKDSGFESDHNEILAFSRIFSKPMTLKRQLKSRLAEKILDMAGKIGETLRPKGSPR
jgi:phosphopantothenoylcysteine decarboxylase/phosphopantothenate--cysteine ligase